MRGIRPLLAVAVLVLGTGAAQAVCPGLDVLLEDDFAGLAPGWGDAGPELRVENDRLLVSPSSGTDIWRENTTGLYDDVDMCVNLTVVQGVEPAEAKAGPIFWFEDVNNFYVFQIAPNGMVSVWRRQRGQWLEQIGWREAESANTGDGGTNELRVTTVADTATFYVNGTRIESFQGDPPELGQQVGVFASSPVADRAIFAFDALRVTRP